MNQSENLRSLLTDNSLFSSNFLDFQEYRIYQNDQKSVVFNLFWLDQHQIQNNLFHGTILPNKIKYFEDSVTRHTY